jgi:hypothetical protein
MLTSMGLMQALRRSIRFTINSSSFISHTKYEKALETTLFLLLFLTPVTPIHLKQQTVTRAFSLSYISCIP